MKKALNKTRVGILCGVFCLSFGAIAMASSETELETIKESNSYSEVGVSPNAQDDVGRHIGSAGSSSGWAFLAGFMAGSRGTEKELPMQKEYKDILGR